MDIGGIDINKKTAMYGGVALLALVGVFYFMKSRSADASGGEGMDSILQSYTIPVAGSGGSSVVASDNSSSGSNTDTSAFDYALDIQRLRGEQANNQNAFDFLASLFPGGLNDTAAFSFNSRVTDGSVWVGFSRVMNAITGGNSDPGSIVAPPPSLPASFTQPPPYIPAPPPPPAASTDYFNGMTQAEFQATFGLNFFQGGQSDGGAGDGGGGGGGDGGGGGE